MLLCVNIAVGVVIYVSLAGEPEVPKRTKIAVETSHAFYPWQPEDGKPRVIRPMNWDQTAENRFIAHMKRMKKRSVIRHYLHHKHELRKYRNAK